MPSPAVTQLTDQFFRDVQEMVMNAVSIHSLGAMFTSTAAAMRSTAAVMRRKAPIQLCPAPRCKERAAPVYGMLCDKHKGTPKKTVSTWRAARRARKAIR